MEDRRSVGASSCNSGDGTDQRVQSLMFMMMMMMFMMMMMMMMYMFGPLLWPSSGRCHTKDELQKRTDPLNKCEISRFKCFVQYSIYVKIPPPLLAGTWIIYH